MARIDPGLRYLARTASEDWARLRHVSPYGLHETAGVSLLHVDPQAPPGTSTHGLPVHVEIHVAIDAKGNVTSATPIGATAVTSPFMSVAVRAARSWLFKPAELNGRPIASEMNLVFQF